MRRTMLFAVVGLSAGLSLPSVGLAEDPKSLCAAMIEKTAAAIPDLSETSDAAKKIGLTEEQLEATR